MNKKKKYVVVNEKRLIMAIIVCLIIIFGASIPMINYIKSVNKKMNWYMEKRRGQTVRRL
ncbi:hypothetical protein [Clostridium senegalense]|uniref:hypothetical protein n=1 Tax=Clostridium senegalense TaxID=1465809 RepID=UPI0002D82BA8|nr:hypothetical protein [Clostridium senegalense]